MQNARVEIDRYRGDYETLPYRAGELGEQTTARAPATEKKSERPYKISDIRTGSKLGSTGTNRLQLICL